MRGEIRGFLLLKNKSDMRFEISKTEIVVSFWFVAMITLYAISAKTSFYTILAIVIHELAHLIALLAFKVEITQLRFTVRDVNLVANSKFLSDGRQMMVAASGPMANIMLGVIFWNLNREISYANFIIGILQSLPIVSLDGGTLVEIVFKNHGIGVRKIISLAFSFLLFLGGGILFIMSEYNISFLIIGAYLIFLSVKG